MVGGFALKVKLNFGVLFTIIGSYCSEEDASLAQGQREPHFSKTIPFIKGLFLNFSCCLSMGTIFFGVRINWMQCWTPVLDLLHLGH